MFHKPKTKVEAAAYLYCRWAGASDGIKYDPARCAEEVWPSGRGFLPHQCSRKNGHGPDGLYCVQHAKKIGKALRDE